jgi:isopentenyl phosphate kinase
MPTWILRKNVDGERIGEPRPCVGPKDIARRLGMLTIEEQIANMLAENETAESYRDAQSHADATRKIFSGDELVGYIAVLSTDLP